MGYKVLQWLGKVVLVAIAEEFVDLHFAGGVRV